MIEKLAERVNGDAHLVWMGRFLDVDFLVEVGDTPFHIRIERGRVAEIVEGRQLMRPWTFAIRASAEAWSKFWTPVPEPDYHDIFAMAKAGEAKIEGDLQPLLANLRYVKELLAAPRPAATEVPVSVQDSEPEPIVGRYRNVDILGRKNRVYWEAAGSGIPLVCLHTAGADGQQFRHLMCDPSVTDRYRVIAFDMPWHGKSLPPAGYHREEYRLTTELYAETIRAVCGALKLDKPVIMGCSMGGRIVLHLARHWPEEFRAVIGLEGSDHQQPWYDTEWLHRPDVHGGEVCAALVSGLVAPTSPDEARWETLWGYLASGPGIFKGDLYFYRADSDYRSQVADIDTGRCPIYLLTGAYDYSCTPEDTVRTAAQIDGAEATIMENLGHFPMSENPALFRKYIEPVLANIEFAAAER